MTPRRFWDRTFRLRRVLLCVFIGWHLSVIVLNCLPWSPFVDRLFPFYHPYLTYTGTVQDGWAMYSEVHTTDNHYRLVGSRIDGTEFYLDDPGQTLVGQPATRFRDFLEERHATFLESFGYGVPEELHSRFGEYLCRRHPEIVAVRMEMISAPIPPLADWTGPLAEADYTSSVVFVHDCALPS